MMSAARNLCTFGGPAGPSAGGTHSTRSGTCASTGMPFLKLCKSRGTLA